MKTIALSSYSTSITNEDIGDTIFSELIEALKTNEQIEIDLEGIIVMTTFCAKQIFGKLYKILGKEKFGERVFFKNASEDLKIVINHGILKSI